MTKFTCPGCHARLKVPAAKAGAVITCPRCRKKCHLPGPAPADDVAVLDEDPPATRPTGKQPAKAPTPPARMGWVWEWLLASVVGFGLLVGLEVLLLIVFGYGRHQAWAAAERRHNLVHLDQEARRNFYAEADRDFPHLPQAARDQVANRRYDEALDRAARAGKAAVDDYGDAERFWYVVLATFGLLAIPVTSVALAVGGLFLVRWLRRRS